MSSNPFIQLPPCLTGHFLKVYLTLNDCWLLRLVDKYFCKVITNFPQRYYQSSCSMIRHCYSFKDESLKFYVLANFGRVTNTYKDRVGDYLSYFGITDRADMTAPRLRPMILPQSKLGVQLFKDFLRRSPMYDIEELVEGCTLFDYMFDVQAMAIMNERLRQSGAKQFSWTISRFLMKLSGSTLSRHLNPLTLDAAIQPEFDRIMAARLAFGPELIIEAIIGCNKHFVDRYIKFALPEDLQINKSDLTAENKDYITKELKLPIIYDLAHVINKAARVSTPIFCVSLNKWQTLSDDYYNDQDLLKAYKLLLKLPTSSYLSVFYDR